MSKSGDQKRGERRLDLGRLRTMLLEERKRVLEELGYIEDNYLGKTPREATGSGSAYSMHPADMGTDSIEQEKAYMIGAASGAVLEDIDDALRRIDGEAFGRCEKCGQEITEDRLLAVPYARLCLKCKTDSEKAGGAP
jgi:RNA polymerase-binding transcription factor DksA